jgi:hypothetical protein
MSYSNPASLSPQGKDLTSSDERQPLPLRVPGLTFDDLVKSQKVGFPVIPANPGSGPGQAPESSLFKEG